MIKLISQPQKIVNNKTIKFADLLAKLDADFIINECSDGSFYGRLQVYYYGYIHCEDYSYIGVKWSFFTHIAKSQDGVLANICSELSEYQDLLWTKRPRWLWGEKLDLTGVEVIL